MSWPETVDLKFFRFINLELRHPALDALMPQFASNDWFFPAVILLAIGLIWKGGARGRLLVLTLALIPYFFETGCSVRETRMGVNSGLNKVRFTAPVPVGSRLRAAFKLLALDDVAGGAKQLTVEVAIEAEGATKPVCVAESLARHYR